MKTLYFETTLGKLIPVKIISKDGFLYTVQVVRSVTPYNKGDLLETLARHLVNVVSKKGYHIMVTTPELNQYMNR